MRPLPVAVALLTATLALSGCIQDSTLGVGHAARAARAEADADDGAADHWSDTVDLLPYLREDRVALVAFQATENLTLDVRMDKELSYDGGGAVCSVGSLRPDAPVDHLIDVSNNQAGPAPDHTPGGDRFMGGGGTDMLSLTVDGEEVLDSKSMGMSLSTWTSSSRAEASMELAKGEWLLVTAGLHGADPDDLDEESAWTVKLDATAALEREALPTARLACGHGFAEHARTRVSTVAVDPSASASWTGDYAADLRVLTFGGEADGYFEFDERRIPLKQNMDVHHFAWGEVPAGFEVADPGDAWVFWVFQGV